ncbi:MAG: 50S ribosomal protein L10 [Candidatus Eisenbacteria bacterium]|nr:50S ribosomal protein L10 [Candidatus Eisenbacteria bacterium]
MSTPQKEQILRETSERITGVRGLYLADLSGMTVASVSLLRKRCREQQVQVRVVKNTLLKRAFNQRGIRELDDFLVGPTGLVYSALNEMAPAKLLSDFVKEFEKPRVKAAIVDGRLFDAGAIAKLATLPSREVLLSQLLSTFIAPMTQFLAAVDATLRLPATMADVLEREKQKAS